MTIYHPSIASKASRPNQKLLNMLKYYSVWAWTGHVKMSQTLKSTSLFCNKCFISIKCPIRAGNENQNHPSAENVYLLCKRGRRCPNTEKTNQSPISIKGGNSPQQPTKGSPFYIKLSEVAPGAKAFD